MGEKQCVHSGWEMSWGNRRDVKCWGYSLQSSPNWVNEFSRLPKKRFTSYFCASNGPVYTDLESQSLVHCHCIVCRKLGRYRLPYVTCLKFVKEGGIFSDGWFFEKCFFILGINLWFYGKG